MIGAVSTSVNTTIFAAFGVGFLSFVSPCVLPLVPGYLSAISGVSFSELAEGKGRVRVLGPSLLFCLSFTVMFVALGMTATGLGRTLQDHRTTLRHVAAILIIVMGVLFVAAMFVPRLNREWRPNALISRASTGGPMIAGLAVPFILSALAFTRVTAIFRFFRKHYAVITVASGVVLVAMGVALYTDQLTRVNSWLNDLGINGISNL